MSGGCSRWRCFLATEVSPVRLSTAIFSPIFGDRGHQVALHVHRQRLQGRDVEGVDAGLGVARRALGKLHQARQEPGQRLAAAGGRDQQGVATRPPLGHHLQLMPPRPPAPRVEPGVEPLGQTAFSQQALRRGGGHLADIACSWFVSASNKRSTFLVSFVSSRERGEPSPFGHLPFRFQYRARCVQCRFNLSEISNSAARFLQ